MSTIPYRRPGDPRQPRPQVDTHSVAEQFLKDFQLTGDPSDQLIVEVLREADRQEEMCVGGTAPPNVRSQMSERRAGILIDAAKLLEARQARRDRTSIANVVGRVLLAVRDTLLEKNFDPGQVNQLLDLFGARIADSQTD